ncbi:MAG TPA: class III extradiol ring-cleavage dioxygenase [Acidisarcina sp.]|nr:class III extradiol ring-cleavage dioxygenase [Acidisarcina sp.]
MDQAQQQPALFPVGFVAHGAPTLAIDPERGAPFRSWGAALPQPKAILVISAHFERAPLTIGVTEQAPLVYDFSGFPPELYCVQYAAPGAPELAQRVLALLSGHEIHESNRGLDHGVWTPLVHMAPAADIPVLEISMPYNYSPAQLFQVGQALAPLRKEGIFILGSGNLVHNLRLVDFYELSGPPPWAREFDAWVREVLLRRDWDSLMQYPTLGPAIHIAHPTAEHLRPLLVAAGAAADDDVRFVLEGWEYGSLSRRTVQFG